MGQDAKIKHYQYEPLLTDQIRILELQPGRFGEPLYARLRHIKLSITADDNGMPIEYPRDNRMPKLDIDLVNIDELPQRNHFDAIWYVWASSEKLHEIII